MRNKLKALQSRIEKLEHTIHELTVVFALRDYNNLSTLENRQKVEDAQNRPVRRSHRATAE